MNRSRQSAADSSAATFQETKAEGRRQKAEGESVSFIRSGWRAASEAAPKKHSSLGQGEAFR